MRSLALALRGELRLRHPLTRAPTMAADSSPGSRGPAGRPGGVDSPVRLPRHHVHLRRGATPKADRSGQFYHLRPPPTFPPSWCCQPSCRRPGESLGDEMRKHRQEQKYKRGTLTRANQKRVANITEVPISFSWDFFFFWFFILHLKKSHFSTFENDCV